MSHDIVSEIAAFYQYDPDFVRFHAANSYRYYAKASIPKRTGGKRDIYIPSSEMKLFQYYILDHYLSKIPVSSNATAYSKRSSVLTNAYFHRNNTYFLHADLHHFFDTISEDQVLSVLHATSIFTDWTDKELMDLVSFLTLKGLFPQGAVTSPCISNIVFCPIDDAINDQTIKLSNGIYTRYSDDITISSNRPLPEDFQKNVFSILREHGFLINSKKTHCDSTAFTVKITGICLNGGKLSLSARFKKELRNSIYRFLKNKLPEKQDVIRGRLSYLKTIDPDYVTILKKKYRTIGSKARFYRLFKKF